MKFRLVDKIISWTPYQQIVGLKAVSFEEYNLKAAWGDAARLPETLLLESLLQLGNWLILLSSDFTHLAQVVRIAEVHFHDFLRPGQSMRMRVTLARRREDGFEFFGEGRVQDRVILTGQGCLAVPVPAAAYLDPESMRVLYSEIGAPEEAVPA